MPEEDVGDLWGQPGQSSRVLSKNRNGGVYRVVSVRLRESEFQAFSAQARALGLTHSLALRVAARRIGGFLEVDAESRALLRRISNDIGEISLAIGKVSRLAAATDCINMEKLAECRASFGREFAVLDDRLQTLLNVSRRRLDGRAVLKDALSS